MTNLFRSRLALFSLACLTAVSPAFALAALPAGAFELLYTAPVETTLTQPALRDAAAVWPELFDQARSRIDIGQMYASGKPGEPLDKSIEALERAGKRGVKIRFLLEKKMQRASTEETLARLRAIPGLELEVIDFAALAGDGIHHAKYFVIDGKQAFLGSQNFDWRALKHIQELGVRISDPKIVAQMQAIFDADWKALKTARKNSRQAPLQKARPSAPTDKPAYLVASPWSMNPKGVGDSEQELVRLIGTAKKELRAQVMDYYPLAYGKKSYYGVIDQALREASARGVSVKLLVSDWSVEPVAIDHLKSLAMIPNVEIRVVSIPEAKEGFIPFARVVHSKFMVVDNTALWVGTSNWTGGYLNQSRNLELVMKDEAMAAAGIALHSQLWDSPYVTRVESGKEYKVPRRN